MNQVIPFPKCSSTEFDYAAYNRRAVGRYRSHMLRCWLATAVDCAISAVIGVCVAVSTLVFLTIV